MQTFDATMKETRDMENFIFDIEDDKELKIEPEKKTEHKRQEKAIGGSNIIQVGSPVTLANDDTAIGAVIAKDGNKYTVLINNKFETYYEEQIKLVQEKRKTHMYLFQG